jgi:hypothetical protein
LIYTTMLSLKTTIAALIAAISVIATASVATTLTPQAFAQQADDDNGGTTVRADQSNSVDERSSQEINQAGSASTGTNGNDDTAATGTNDDDGSTAIVVQDADQGFCKQINQQNAAAGSNAANFAGNSIAAGEGSTVDCS